MSRFKTRLVLNFMNLRILVARKVETEVFEGIGSV